MRLDTFDSWNEQSRAIRIHTRRIKVIFQESKQINVWNAENRRRGQRAPCPFCWLDIMIVGLNIWFSNRIWVCLPEVQGLWWHSSMILRIISKQRVQCVEAERERSVSRAVMFEPANIKRAINNFMFNMQLTRGQANSWVCRWYQIGMCPSEIESKSYRPPIPIDQFTRESLGTRAPFEYN